MLIDVLLQECNLFAKFAQQLNKTKVDPARKAALIQAANTLYAGFRGAGTYLASVAEAKKVFDSVAKYHASPAYSSDASFRTVESLLTALQEGANKVRALGLDPLEALKQRGVQNVTPTTLNVLMANLEVLRDANDFSNYRQYNIGTPSAAHTYIDLDEPEPAKNDPGY